jgi:hypothetical protein
MTVQVFARLLMRFMRESSLNGGWPPESGYQSRRA